ncbi:glutathione S-transferase family protein [Rhizobium yanglingense]
MEFGSSILADLWVYETTSDRRVLRDQTNGPCIEIPYHRNRSFPADHYFVGKSFSLVDAVFAPIFRYFDVFDTISDDHIFDGLEKRECVGEARLCSGRV